MRSLRTVFITCILFSSVSAVAQDKAPSFIGVNGGISLPMGNWSKTNYEDNKSGFAGAGPQVAIDGAYFFSKHIGVGALVNYSSYKTRDINGLSAGYQDAFDVDQVTTTAGSYRLWNFLPGLYFNFPAHPISITARALAGITHATTPLVAVDVMDADIDDGTFEQKESTANSFGFDLGVGISYPVIKQIAINLRADYFYSNPDFQIENTNRQNKAGRLVNEYHQPLTGINISLGVAYCFSKK